MGKRDRDRDPAPAPFHNPFGGLAERLGITPAPPAAEPLTSGAGSPSAPARAVVRLERKGRGGKEVTVVEKLGLGARDLERWLLDLKRVLGCGGAVEGDALALQGDLRARLAPLLEARGVRKVTIA